MNKPLRILMVEDSENDILAVIQALKQGGYEPIFERVEDAGGMRKALREKTWDVVLCAYRMPKFNGLAALALLKETAVEVPLIILSGAIGEEAAVECMRSGARDCVMTDNLSRLVPAIKRDLKEADSRSRRTRAEMALRESEKRFKSLYQESPIPTFTWQKKGGDFILVDFNRAALQLTDGKVVDQLGSSALELYRDDPQILGDMELCYKEQSVVSRDLVSRHFAPGRILSVHYAPIPPDMIIVHTEDRTERKRAEEDVRAGRAQLSNALEIAHLGHWEYDVAGDLFTFNDQFYKIFRTTAEQVGGYTMPSAEYVRRFVHPDDMAVVGEETRKAIETTDPHFSRQIEHRMLYADGTEGYIAVRFFVVKDGRGRTVKTHGVNQDITERKRAERVLRESEERYRSLFDHSKDAILLTRPDGSILDANPAACEMFGRSLEELKKIGRNGLADTTDPHLHAALSERARKGSEMAEITMLRADGAKFPVEITSAIFVDLSGQQKTSMIIRDVTERKRAEDVILKEKLFSNAVLDSLPDVFYVLDEQGDFVRWNKNQEKVSGYSGEEMSKLRGLAVIAEEDRDAVARAIQEALTGEYVSLEAQLLTKSGKKIPYYVTGKGTVIGDKTYLLGMGIDITERKKNEEHLKIMVESLRKAVGATIQVMVAAVETRDPYTAGHQLRVADLARAIATEMGLSQEEIQGVRMASSIHDIGKLSTPAEILSKPTKLTEFEFSLVKEHARKGYEILKDVETSWPLAEIVYQHHERMDGSGYPRHLKGEEILIEARILNVADVVEAMASHRPYRAGLGIDQALEEIEKNRGAQYDVAVVDACLKLFRERDYQFRP